MMSFQWIFTTFVMAVLLLPVLRTSAQETQIILDMAALTEIDKTMNGNPYLFFQPRGLRWCAEECKRRPLKCLSFNYVLSTLRCELNDKSLASTGANLVTKTGTIYSEAALWPDNMLGPCDALDCSALQRCDVDHNGNAVCFPTECPNPPNVSNAGLPLYFSKELGYTVTYVCNNGYILNGQPSVTCKTSAEWTTPTFTCDDCGPPPIVPLATPIGSSRSPGSTVIYVCDSGTTLAGSTLVACDANGHWATPTVTCTPGYSTTASGNAGVLISPGYPGNYTNDMNVIYTVTLDQAGPQSVSVSINYYLEHRSSGGCYDWVMVNNDGVKYCNAVRTTDTKTISVSGTTWLVNFYSDFSNTRAAGFRLSYYVL